MVVIDIVDNGFWLVLPVDVGIELGESHKYFCLMLIFYFCYLCECTIVNHNSQQLILEVLLLHNTRFGGNNYSWLLCRVLIFNIITSKAKLKCCTLGFQINFMIVLNLIIFEKENILYILLVNTSMYLNLIEKPNILHLKNYT